MLRQQLQRLRQRLRLGLAVPPGPFRRADGFGGIPRTWSSDRATQIRIPSGATVRDVRTAIATSLVPQSAPLILSLAPGATAAKEAGLKDVAFGEDRPCDDLSPREPNPIRRERAALPQCGPNRGRS